MAMTRHASNNYAFIMESLETLVPQDHIVRRLEHCIDWGFIYPKVSHLYSPVGRPSIDPVILFKMLCINIVFGYNSMRRTCREIETNFAYRWFLGISVNEPVPNYSTWSQNYIRRFGESEIFSELFDHILKRIYMLGSLDLETVFGDSMHQKANANKNKFQDAEIKKIKKAYEDELLEEINKDRADHGRKPLKSIRERELQFDEATGEEIEVEARETIHIKQSRTDPESGAFHKGEKQKCFAYSHQTFCDRHGYVVSHTTVAGNIHDSNSFFEAYKKLKKMDTENEIENLCLDAGYITPAICREIIKDDKKLFIPYKRPMTKKGFFKKHEYVYDEGFDCYICPNDKVLEYSTTNKGGYREYKSDPRDCETCPFLDRCTKSRNHQKVVTRHIWEDYKEEAAQFKIHTTSRPEEKRTAGFVDFCVPQSGKTGKKGLRKGPFFTGYSVNWMK